MLQPVVQQSYMPRTAKTLILRANLNIWNLLQYEDI